MTAEADSAAAYLAEAREHADALTKARAAYKPRGEQLPSGACGEWVIACVAAGYDHARLLAAVEAVLAPHHAGRTGIRGSLCGIHESYRDFSITSTEAADLTACASCKAIVYVSCDACGTQVLLEHCPVRSAITTALLGEVAADGT